MGCSDPGDHYTIYLDDNFTDPQVQELTEIFVKWERAAIQFDLKFDIRRGWTIPKQHATFTLFAGTLKDIESSFGKDILGETYITSDCDCGVLDLGMDISDVNERKTMEAHEIGHLLSLLHTGAETLMSPAYGNGYNPNAITCADVEQYAVLRGKHSTECTEAVEIAPLSY